MKRNHRIEEDQVWFTQPEQKSPLFTSQEIAKLFLHRVHLRDIINEPQEYNDLFDLMSTRPDDVYEFTINTPGGDLNTTIELLHHIKNLPPENVRMVVVAANSAGSVIMLASNNIEVVPHASMMIHDVQIGPGNGDLGKAYSMIRFSKETLKDFYQDVYEGFLTDEEIISVTNGQDFWFGEKEIVRRLKQREKHFATKLQSKPKKKKTTVSKEKVVNKTKKE